MLTWIFWAVLGSMNCLTVLHKSLNPGPPLMMNIRFKVYNNQEIRIALAETRTIYSSKERQQAENKFKTIKLITSG
jgi:hypothetical protein